jgi:hypothetical protein
MSGIQGYLRSEYAQNVNRLTGIEKECVNCHQKKSVGLFTRDRTRPDGYHPYCKICRNTLRKSGDKEKLFRQGVRYREKHKDDLRKKKQIFYQKNKKQINEKNKTYYQQHKEEIRIKAMAYYQNNKDATKERSYAWLKNKLSKDPVFRMIHRFRFLIGYALRGKKNRRRWESLVGYTPEQLKNHIESLFVDGMSWDNYGRGGWHIDHIIPISAFNFEKPEDLDFKRCWSLSNLQPMWEQENFRKNRFLKKSFQPSLLLGESCK